MNLLSNVIEAENELRDYFARQPNTLADEEYRQNLPSGRLVRVIDCRKLAWKIITREDKTQCVSRQEFTGDPAMIYEKVDMGIWKGKWYTLIHSYSNDGHEWYSVFSNDCEGTKL